MFLLNITRRVDVFFFHQDAVGHNYVADVAQHSSQTDAAKGFGGKFGVQKDRVDRVRYTYHTLHHTLHSVFL